jgi:hypothetical protein
MATLGIILMVILVLLLTGLVPAQTDGRNWSQSGSGILGAFLVVVLLLTASVRI